MTLNSTHIALIVCGLILIMGIYKDLPLEMLLGLITPFLAYAGLREKIRINQVSDALDSSNKEIENIHG